MIGLGLGIQKAQLLGGAAAAYTRAVIADGGTVESQSCVKATFSELKAIKLVGWSQTVAYQTAVVADSGSLESFSCTRNTFIDLTEIDIS